eukprot:8035-Eustigmatos_ZCMA.PRE.1
MIVFPLAYKASDDATSSAVLLALNGLVVDERQEGQSVRPAQCEAVTRPHSDKWPPLEVIGR